jgi:hypothetical protein
MELIVEISKSEIINDTNLLPAAPKIYLADTKATSGTPRISFKGAVFKKIKLRPNRAQQLTSVPPKIEIGMLRSGLSISPAIYEDAFQPE